MSPGLAHRRSPGKCQYGGFDEIALTYDQASVPGSGTMTIITCAELRARFDQYHDRARHEAVIVTLHGEADIVMIAADEYARLRALDRRSQQFDSMSDEEIAEMLTAEIPVAQRYSLSDLPG